MSRSMSRSVPVPASRSIEGDIRAERWAFVLLVLELFSVGIAMYCLTQWDSPLATTAISMLIMASVTLVVAQLIRWYTIPYAYRRFRGGFPHY